MSRSPTVLFESWRGRFADSPAAVSDALAGLRPSLRRVWASNGSTEFPGGTRTVRRHTPAYFARLLACDGLVTNDIVTRQVVKGPRVRYVQTWHGTPLKLVGFDETHHAYDVRGRHRRRMERDVAHWDHLVSPSPACTEILRSAFRYDGEVWETGYPRNDVLRSAAAGRVRARTRAALGLPDGAFAVLYAPTWRDDDAAPGGGFRMSVHVDPSRLAGGVPERTRVLSRMHPNVTVPPDYLRHPMMVDASRVPDIAHLYLAADALVSDYSSAVYDFAVTGKPIVLFAPDLEEYRDRVRGMYFDYEEWAPGPICRTEEELAQHLTEVAGVARDETPRYAAFVQRFCPHEDGGAAVRVAQRLVDASGW